MNKELQGLLQVDYNKSKNSQTKYELDGKMQSVVVDQTIFINEIHSLYLYDNKDLRVYMQRRYGTEEKEKFFPNPNLNKFTADGSIKLTIDNGMVNFESMKMEL
jgi:hypothetical protein